MRHALNTFFNVLLVIAKLAFIVIVFFAAMALVLAPAFWFALNLHWSIGVIHFVLCTAALMTVVSLLTEISNDDRPVWNWLEKGIPERNRDENQVDRIPAR